jgi:hypothetical protein
MAAGPRRLLAAAANVGLRWFGYNVSIEMLRKTMAANSVCARAWHGAGWASAETVERVHLEID